MHPPDHDSRTSRVDLRWVRPVRQERSQRTLERLLDAAEAVIEEKGFADASVADICDRAGTAVGTFYRRFRDKHTLMHALHDRWADRFRETMERGLDPGRWEGAAIEAILRAYLEFSLAFGRNVRGLRRAATLMSLRDPAFGERQVRLNRELRASLRDLLRARRDEIRHPEPDVAIDFALEQLRATLLARLDGEPIYTELPSLTDADFVAEAIASARAYLRLDEGVNHGHVL